MTPPRPARAAAPRLYALDDGPLAGAGLDVFSPENPHLDPDWSCVVKYPNVVVTSQRGFLSADAERSSRERAVAEVSAVLDCGLPLHGAVRPTGGEQAT